MTGSIDYGGMMHRAVQGLITQVLQDVARDGLPGEHHFFINFDTTDSGVKMAPWLRDRYPESMTIVLQEWFEDLVVTDQGFAVTLNFGDQLERMTVPFSAMRSFVDPSVEFGFRFEAQNEAGRGEGTGAGPDDEPDDDPGNGNGDGPGKAGPGGGEVVSLDRWRR